MSTLTIHLADSPPSPGIRIAPRLERRPPESALGPHGRRLASVSSDLGVTDECAEAGLVIPPYGDFKQQYSCREWALVRSAFAPEGSVTTANAERWIGLAGELEDATPRLSNRSFSQMSARLSGRVSRLMRARDGWSDRSQESLREIIQREYLPAVTRITILAQAVADGLEDKALGDQVQLVGDLPEALPFLHQAVRAWGGKPPPVVADFRRRAERLIARDLVEVLDPYLRAGGSTADAALTRLMRRELAAEGYQFFRSGRYCMLNHPGYPGPDALATTQHDAVRFLLAAGRRSPGQYLSLMELRPLAEEVALTAAELQISCGASTAVAAGGSVKLGTFDGYEHAQLRLLVYASGMSNVTDLQALTDARHPIGVVAGLLRGPGRQGDLSRAMRTLIDAVDQGVPAFVDSGAFTAFRRGESMDWDHVLGVYADLGRGISPDKRHLLSVMLPDVVGDQAATWRLQQEHVRHVHQLQQMGVSPMLAIQQGPKDPAVCYRELVDLIGNPHFVVALPCNEQAFSNDQVLSFASQAAPPRLHLLGRYRDSRRILSHLSLFAPGTVVSSDANRLRAKLGQDRELTIAAKGGAQARSAAAADSSYTDAVMEILHLPGTLSPDQTASLARSLGITDPIVLDHWKRSCHQVDNAAGDDSYGSALGVLLHHHHHGDEAALVHSCWSWMRGQHHLDVSPSVRRELVASAFRQDLVAMHAADRAEEEAHGHISLRFPKSA